jgi:hypothetical protein
MNWAVNHPQPHYPTSHVSFEIEEESPVPLSPEKAQPHKPLLLLCRSRGVQTDPWLGGQGLYPQLILPHDARSDSSSITDSQPSNMTILVERVVSLLNRMTQADALTLTNRLKRQNLKGADLGHLSRVTVGGIVSDATNLRTQFRPLLEDERIVTACTRKDLRGLFKLFKDTFVEMGQLRITLNDVILDPAIAPKLRELALNPSKAEVATPSPPPSAGWMAPISKLFGSSAVEGNVQTHHPLSANSEEGRGRAKSRPPHRVIPKLGPALSASTTTVNVEFSGTGVGRAVTSTIKAHGEATVGLPTSTLNESAYHPPSNLMRIFAGAPASSTPDPWVVLNKPPRAVRSTQPNMLEPLSFKAANLTNNEDPNRLSRNVDAIIDASSANDVETDSLGPLLRRTLQRRGLSDSSIHSTFISQADDSRLPGTSNGPPSRETLPDKVSVLKALSRTVQNLRFTASPLVSTSTSPPVASNLPEVRTPLQTSNASEGAAHSANSPPPNTRGSSPLVAFLPNVSSWASASASFDPNTATEPFYVGSLRDESLFHQVRGHGGHGRDFL